MTEGRLLAIDCWLLANIATDYYKKDLIAKLCVKKSLVATLAAS